MKEDLKPGDVVYFAIDGRYDRTVIAKVDDRRAYCLKLKIVFIDGRWIGFHGFMQTKVELKPESEKVKMNFFLQRQQQKNKIIRGS